MLCDDHAAVACLKDQFLKQLGARAELAEVRNIDKALAVLEGLRNQRESIDRVLETARSSDMSDSSLQERIEESLGPSIVDRLITQVFREPEDG